MPDDIVERLPELPAPEWDEVIVWEQYVGSRVADRDAYSADQMRAYAAEAVRAAPAERVAPQGWQGLVARLRSGLAAGSRSMSNSDYELEFGGALLDAVSEGLELLSERVAPERAQPVAWMWQHDETGRIGFVDTWQAENGWQANNPRCRLVRPLYTHPAPAALATAEAARPAQVVEARAKIVSALCAHPRAVPTLLEEARDLLGAAITAQPAATPDALGASASPTALSAPALRASAPIAGADDNLRNPPS